MAHAHNPTESVDATVRLNKVRWTAVLEKRPYDVVIGLGSNIGTALTYFGEAKRAINGLDTAITHQSPIYRSEAVGPNQAWYSNAALRVTTTTPLRELLTALTAIEDQMGRSPSASRVSWQPRRLDLDVLWILQTERSLLTRTATLWVPHPGVHTRAFMSQPLMDVTPELATIFVTPIAPKPGSLEVLEGRDCW